MPSFYPTVSMAVIVKATEGEKKKSLVAGLIFTLPSKEKPSHSSWCFPSHGRTHINRQEDMTQTDSVGFIPCGCRWRLTLSGVVASGCGGRPSRRQPVMAARWRTAAVSPIIQDNKHRFTLRRALCHGCRLPQSVKFARLVPSSAVTGGGEVALHALSGSR